MQLEDPRIRYRQLQNEHASTESIPMQTSSQVISNIFIMMLSFLHFFFFVFQRKLNQRKILKTSEREREGGRKDIRFSLNPLWTIDNIDVRF